MEALDDSEILAQTAGKGSQTPFTKNTMPIKKMIGQTDPEIDNGSENSTSFIGEERVKDMH